jgi:GNAT superfamily N-acetyltransferase
MVPHFIGINFGTKMFKFSQREEQREISFENQGGDIWGYEAPIGSEYLFNYLTLHLSPVEAKRIIKTLNSKEDFAVVKSLFVDDRKRGKGYGNDLMESFLGDTGASVIFLLADSQPQKEGFNLIKFYESFGFEVIKSVTNGTLMIKRN